MERARVVADAAHSAAPGASPAPASAGSSLWPIAQVLITRCWPNVSATNEPSSTISSSAKCSRSRAHSASSTAAGFQIRLLV
jgi:hypothetical protein